MRASARDPALLRRFHQPARVSFSADRSVDPYVVDVQPPGPNVSEDSAHDLSIAVAQKKIVRKPFGLGRSDRRVSMRCDPCADSVYRLAGEIRADDDR